MFGVYTCNDGQAGDAYAQRERHVADDIDIWWIVEIGNNASRWWDGWPIEKLFKLPWHRRASGRCHCCER